MLLLKIHMKSLFLLQQNQPFATSSLLHTKTAIKGLFRTVFRIKIFYTEAEINRFFEEQLTWYTLYMAESVVCDWAGAMMQKLPEKRRKNKCVTDRPTDRPTDQPTNQPTNRRTDTVGYRVACTRLKRVSLVMIIKFV